MSLLFKRFVLRNLSSVHTPIIRAQGMPFIKKYLDRPEYFEKIHAKELTDFANKLLQERGVCNKTVTVIVAEDNDAIFTINRGAVMFELVDSLLIIIQKDFYDNYTPSAIQALVCHEVGHVLGDDYVLRYCVIKETMKYCQLLALVFGVLIGLAYSYHIGQATGWVILISLACGYTFFFIITWLYSFIFGQWAQNQEFAADAFAVKICNSGSVLEMFQALTELAPQSNVWTTNLFNRLFAAHPSFERRIAALKQKR